MIATKDQRNQYPAYALTSDDGKTKSIQYPKAYAANHSDDGEKPEQLKPGQLIFTIIVKPDPEKPT